MPSTDGYHANNKKGPRGKAVAAYEYGTLIKRRFENKDFEWGRWKDGLWIASTDGIEKSMYRADELLTADRSQTLWIAEGEKDCDCLRGLGLLATSMPATLGPGKRLEPHHLRSLKQFDSIRVLEDNDLTGRHHARTICTTLREIVEDLRIVCFRDMPEHADVSDWLAAGHTAAELEERANAAPQWTPGLDWDDPVPLSDLGTLPEFKTERLPGWLASMIDAMAIELQVPTALAATMCLTVVSAALAGKVVAHIRGDWDEPVNLYSVVAMQSSGRKSSVFRMAEAPLDERERELGTSMRDAIAEAENARDLAAQEIKRTREAATKEKDPEKKKALRDEAGRLTREMSRMRAPKAPRLVAGDVTAEKLGAMLCENEGRMAVLNPEGGLFRLMAGRYSADRSPNFEIYLKGWAGDTLRVDRKGAETVYVYRPALTMGLLVQPSVIRGLTENPAFRGEGLLARFLWVLPRSLMGERDSDAPTIPQSISSAYHRHIRWLLNIEPTQDENKRPAPHVIELTREAQAEVVSFLKRIEPRLGPEGDLHHINDWAGKLVGQSVRIAGLLHLAAHSQESEPWRTPLEATTLRAAIEYAEEFFLPHALAAFTEMGRNPAVGLAQDILTWVRKRDEGTVFNRRDLHRGLRRQVNDKTEKWEAPLQLLVDCGWIRAVAKAGKRTAEFEVHPRVLACESK
jgi:hypothetical protein